ncbi:hypothetical protein [Candidatus Parabeggiatoa sp. HSG14]|uniref:hypothetical protein n=1 Tax=Candidatus Parabeggiatoa sp. HSG14 TaxID=3055593 RepID=UPI0025A75D77|nr:hypothetical protein [Thiotrichales bacterium HSG14]
MSYSNSESNQSGFDKKFNRVDILVKDSQERQIVIVIEIQNFRESDYLECILWRANKLTVDTPFNLLWYRKS